MLGIPEAWRHLFPSSIERSMPAETRAVCSKCSMCRHSTAGPQEVDTSRVFFNSSTKCCTYFPALPNYILGGILKDSAPGGAEGRLRIQQILAAKRGVFPTGLASPRIPTRSVSIETVLKTFGVDSNLRCPLYLEESGMCSIWKYREAVCSTWYCKHNDGLRGFLYWAALSDYLAYVQSLLIHYALRGLGWSAADSFSYARSGPFLMKTGRSGEPKESLLRGTDASFETRMLNPEIYHSVWQEWGGHEVELFVATFDIVEKLTYEDVRTIGGLKGEVMEARLLRLGEDIADKSVPEYLVVNPNLRATKQPDGRFLVTSYNAYDPVSLSSDVFEGLSYFRGEDRTEGVNDELETKTGMRFSIALISLLYVRGILVKASSPQFVLPALSNASQLPADCTSSDPI